MIKPVPVKLDLYGGSNNVVYKCRNCDMDFSIYKNKEKFCHNCGEEIDWSDSPLKASTKFEKEYKSMFENMNANRFSKYELPLPPDWTKINALMKEFEEGTFR